MATGDDNIRDELNYLRDEVRRLRGMLNRLTPPLDVLLRRRGFRVFKKEPAEDVLIPEERFRDSFTEMLHKYSFRLFLRDVIKYQDRFSLEQVTRYSAPRVTRSYVNYLLDVRMIKEGGAGYVLSKRSVTSFGPTLEWYIAELLKREFGAEVLWGVKFKRPRVGGDYDVLAKLDGTLLYLEAKSSPPKQIYDSEIAAFLDRVEDLSPEISLFLMDTELRMKDKLVPMFEKALAERSGDPPPVVRLERELFQIRDRIFIVNARESIARNIEKVVNDYFRMAASGRTGMDEEQRLNSEGKRMRR